MDNAITGTHAYGGKGMYYGSYKGYQYKFGHENRQYGSGYFGKVYTNDGVSETPLCVDIEQCEEWIISITDKIESE